MLFLYVRLFCFIIQLVLDAYTVGECSINQYNVLRYSKVNIDFLSPTENPERKKLDQRKWDLCTAGQVQLIPHIMLLFVLELFFLHGHWCFYWLLRLHFEKPILKSSLGQFSDATHAPADPIYNIKNDVEKGNNNNDIDDPKLNDLSPNSKATSRQKNTGRVYRLVGEENMYVIQFPDGRERRITHAELTANDEKAPADLASYYPRDGVCYMGREKEYSSGHWFSTTVPEDTDNTLLGLDCIMSEGKFIVVSIKDGTFAAQTGIQVGDEMHTANDIAIGNLSTEDRYELFIKRPLELVFFRKNEVEIETRVEKNDITNSSNLIGSQHYNQPESLGFIWNSTSGDVTHIHRDTWADRADIRVGDKLDMLNGIRIEKMPAQDVVLKLKTERPLSLVWKRNSNNSSGTYMDCAQSYGSYDNRPAVGAFSPDSRRDQQFIESDNNVSNFKSFDSISNGNNLNQTDPSASPNSYNTSPSPSQQNSLYEHFTIIVLPNMVNLGCEFDADMGIIEVISTNSNSNGEQCWASKLGLRSGDEIESIDCIRWSVLREMAGGPSWEKLLKKRPLVMRVRRMVDDD